ncbi:FUSC family protein [Thalassospira marina]|uniref:FUSC family protein n=2 Tax=Thalassospira marina TaxID=2048283 RepID=A0A2N3KTM9_9PROT|nr:FUSC family protein [Thalassospira marina]
MLAYYISLRVGLPRPSWAIITVYIVSQTSAGASLSRGVYRFAGTFIGAIATVAIVPNFVNEPILCSLILAGWIGLCLFLSLLDRTPRAYAFVLAGYTASLIGFPSVLDPGAVFDIASLRVQEISIGILCAVLIHRYVLPKRMTGVFTAKLATTMQSAHRLARDALNGTPEENRNDRKQLSLDLLALQDLATHLPYDPAPVIPHRRILRLIHDHVARLLLLTAEIEERIHFLHHNGNLAPAELTRLIDDARTWCTHTDEADEGAATPGLIAQARAIQKQLARETASSAELVGANLAGHLAEMIGLLHDCKQLKFSVTLINPLRNTRLLHGSKHAGGYVYHRDPRMAARAALGAITGILCGCTFWIWSGWPEGGTAVSVLGVCCSLFGNFDTPVPFVVKYTIGTLYGIVFSLFYSFFILPQVTDFAVLVAVLAPVFLLAGSLQARLPTMMTALGITLTIPILSGLGTNYSGDFAASLNISIAVLVAVSFGALSMSIFQTVRADTAIKRLLALSRRDIGRRALGHAPNEARWISLMIDRTALLQPKIRASGKVYSSVLEDTLHHLRIGHVAGQLHKMVPLLPLEARAPIKDLLLAMANYVNPRKPAQNLTNVPLNQNIATVMAISTQSPHKNRAQIRDLLIDLYFALGTAPLPQAGKPKS